MFLFTSVGVAVFPVMLNDGKSITDAFVLSAAVQWDVSGRCAFVPEDSLLHSWPCACVPTALSLTIKRVSVQNDWSFCNLISDVISCHYFILGHHWSWHFLSIETYRMFSLQQSSFKGEVHQVSHPVSHWTDIQVVPLQITSSVEPKVDVKPVTLLPSPTLNNWAMTIIIVINFFNNQPIWQQHF